MQLLVKSKTNEQESPKTMTVQIFGMLGGEAAYEVLDSEGSETWNERVNPGQTVTVETPKQVVTREMISNAAAKAGVSLGNALAPSTPTPKSVPVAPVAAKTTQPAATQDDDDDAEDLQTVQAAARQEALSKLNEQPAEEQNDDLEEFENEAAQKQAMSELFATVQPAEPGPTPEPTAEDEPATATETEAAPKSGRGRKPKQG